MQQVHGVNEELRAELLRMADEDRKKREELLRSADHITPWEGIERDILAVS